MIVGPELRLWLADRGAQQECRAQADAFARAWNDGPVCRRLGEAMAGLGAAGAETVAQAIRDLFEAEDWAGELVEAISAALIHNPYFEPPFRHLNGDINSGLLVYEDDRVSIALATVDVASLAGRKSRRRTSASIKFSGQVEVLKFVKAGDARLSLWSAPPIDAGFSAARAGLCRSEGERRLRDGEIMIVDGRRESFVVEQARANILLWQATVKPGQAPVGVEYDSTTHGFVGCSAAGDSASRIQMIATLLRKLGCRDGFAALAAFLDHPDFFVRWHVMRELLGLDLAAALPLLERMAARDPHPETRRAARVTLDRIESGSLVRKAA